MRLSITVCRSGMVSSRLERRICLTNISSFLTRDIRNASIQPARTFFGRVTLALP